MASAIFSQLCSMLGLVHLVNGFEILLCLNHLVQWYLIVINKEMAFKKHVQVNILVIRIA